MKINYDEKTDAKYICLKNTKVVKTSQKKDWLIFDYDKNNEIIGIEILNSIKHPISVSLVNGKFENLGEVKIINHKNILSPYLDSISSNSLTREKILNYN